jgi:serine/threonine protein kinase
MGKNHQYHIIMELVEGDDLKTYIRKKSYGPVLKLETIQSIVKQILDGVTYMHKKRVIHQDLKPSNVMFCKDGKTIKIIDLGISKCVPSQYMKLTRHTVSANEGTIRYQAPEQ